MNDKTEKPCLYCGNLFVPKAINNVYCSTKCRDRYNKMGIQWNSKSAKRKKNGMTLTDIAVAARKAGMSYGMYVSKYGL